MDNPTGLLAGALGAIAFVETFLRLGGMGRTHALRRHCRRAWTVVRSARISDQWKERALPRYACRILAIAFGFIGQLTAALTALLAVTGAVVLAAGQPRGAIESQALSWEFNLAALVVGIAFAAWRGKRGRTG